MSEGIVPVQHRNAYSTAEQNDFFASELSANTLLRKENHRLLLENHELRLENLRLRYQVQMLKEKDQ